MINYRFDAAELVRLVEVAVKEGDDEVAHSREDRLNALLARCVLDRHVTDEEMRVVARFCVKVSKMNFSRWCA